MAVGQQFAGVALDSAGAAIADGVNNVELYDIDQTTTARAQTSTSSGAWSFDHATSGRFDVKITDGSNIIWLRARDQFQVTTLQARSLTTAVPAGHFMSTTDEAATLVAIFAGRRATETAGVETAANQANGDIAYIDLELANDNATPQQFIAARLAWEAVDVSDGSEDGQFNFWTMVAGTLTEELHLDATALWPETNDGLALGLTTLGFSDLHLAAQGVINWANGEVTLTETNASTLTVGGSDFLIADGSGILIGHTVFLNTGNINEFQLIGDSNDDTAITLARFSANASGTVIEMVKSRGSKASLGNTLPNDNDLVGSILFKVADGNDFQSSIARVLGEVDDATPAQDGTGGALVFSTTTVTGTFTEAVRFDAAQDVTFASMPTGAVTNIGHSSNVITIDSSSRELKDNERPLELDSSRIYQLVPKTFEWNDKSVTPGVTDHGFVAQDVHAVIPEAVNMAKDRVLVERTPTQAERKRLSLGQNQKIGTYEEIGKAKPQAIRLPVIVPLMVEEMKKLNDRLTAGGL